MLKLLFSFLLLLGGTGAGWAMAQPLQDRKKQLEQLAALLETLREELRYTRKPLGELAEAIGARSDSAAGRLLNRFGVCLLTDPLQGPVWAMDESLNNTAGLALLEEDLHILRELGTEIGKTDVEGQESLLLRTRSALQKQLREAEELCSGKGRMYRGMGTAAAVLLVVLFL
ncbi:MAG: stage III sporulation protein AB [Firmicutes bacterium]|nr:stage III sporulation protein AB [Bacillota bacterium]